MQVMEKELTGKYNFSIGKIRPLKNYYIMETDEGDRVLKRMKFSPKRLMFIHGAKEHLHENGFKNIDRYICGKDGYPFAVVNGEIYTVTEGVRGRECDFNKREDVIRASKTLAMLHKASKGYEAPSESLARDELGKMPVYLQKRLEELKRTKRMAQRERGKFDYQVLEYIDYFYGLGEDAVNKIYNSEYSGLVKKSRGEKSFCHNDYSHCNIICDEYKTSIINFDFCSYELKIYDITNLLRRKMRKCNWDTNEAKVIIEAYTSVEPISQEEFYIMKAMLQFPQKFWRVVNRYYNSRRTKRGKNFIFRFNESIGEIMYLEKFLKEFEL